MKFQKGLEHVANSKRIIQAKTFHAQTACRCKRKCAENINVSRQRRIYDTFYDLENWPKKTLFIRSLVKVVPKKENLNQVKNIKSKSTYKYFLSSENGDHKEICRRFLLQCLQISQKKLKCAIMSAVTNPAAKELRGRTTPPKKTDKKDLEFLMNFIKKFPCYSSHYGASSSIKKYLNPNLNISKMYRLYVAYCKFKKRKNFLSMWVFRKVFNTKFNLAFKPKKSDTCATCDKLDAQLLAVGKNYEEQQKLTDAKQNHIDLWHKIKQEFEDCVKNAGIAQSKTEVFTFDLQRALEVPSITTSQAFYSRQLWVYNLCIFDEVRRKGYMYVWDESVASRGAEEVFSCIFKYCSNFIPEETENIIAYSDNCPGQNKNIKITIMIKKLLDSWPHQELKKIEQRFLVSGHSYNSCDRCFGLIEREKKISELAYIPKHWINIISEAKKEEPKFTVIEMKRKDFLSSRQIAKVITNRKKSVDGSKVNWLKMQKVINERSNPFELMVEYYSLRPQPLTRVSLKKKKNSKTFSKTNFVPLYTKPRSIMKKKFDDLQKLLKYIPSDYHQFYKSLKYN